MRIPIHPFLIVLGFLAGGASALQAAQPPSTAKKSKGGEPAKPVGQPVEYVSLEHQVGAVIVVETNLNTARRGELVKYTNPALTLQLGPEAGSIQLTVPHDSIRRITLVEPAPAPATAQEAGSAQKN